MAWNAGYVTDVEYSFGYFTELNPLRANYSLAMDAIRPIPVRNACDLGFGQGVSVAIHAAAQPDVQWWGTDFNPGHVAFARRLAESSGAKVSLFDQSFDEFCGRDDLPEFEFIALHGIWSWINDENRAIIVDFIRRKLAIGGILYISYNTLPGWSVQAPMRHLLKQHDLAMGVPSVSRLQRIDESLTFLEKLFEVSPAYIRSNPTFLERFKLLKDQDRSYMAHEYLNASWSPTYFTDVAAMLDDAKLSYVTSSNLLEQQDTISFTNDQIQFLRQLGDVNFRETVRDFITGLQFRRDLWAKGPRRMGTLEHLDTLRKTRFLLVLPRDQVPMKTNSVQGEASLMPAVYNPVLDVLADHKIHTLREIELAVANASVPLAPLINALAVLVGMNAVVVAQPDEAIKRAKGPTAKLNAALMQEATMSGVVNYLASPVTGGGVTINRFSQMFLAARAQGLKGPEEWAKATYQTLAAQGQKLNRNGVPLDSAQESVALLLPDAQELERRLPILQALGIV